MRSALPASQRRSLVAAAGLTAAAAGIEVAGGTHVARFVVAAVALAALAAVVGQAIEDVGGRLGPGATGLLQSTLGNLPELFVGIFALRAGLLELVRAALVGSVLGSALLVLGSAFVAGGLRHGRQRFDPEEPRLYGSLLLLAVAALLVPTLAHHLETPAASHAATLSDVCAGVLLAVYACSIPFMLRSSPAGDPGAPASSARRGPLPRRRPWSRRTSRATRPLPGTAEAGGATTPLPLSIALLVAAGAGAALVSDWFVDALRPAIRSLGISEAFTGLVIVAVASNAVENAVGVRFAWKAKPAYALSTTLASPLQVALLLTPALVLLSNAIAPSPLTLVFPPLLVAALAVCAVVVVAVVYDGEYTWIEGVALLGLYVMIAAAFWWG